jgi:hypothetical protein
VIGAAYRDDMLSADDAFLLRHGEDGLADSGFVFWAVDMVDPKGIDPDEIWIEGWDPTTDPDHLHHVMVNTETREDIMVISEPTAPLVARPLNGLAGESFSIESGGFTFGYASRADGAKTWTLSTANGLPLGYSPKTLTDAIAYIKEWIEFVTCVIDTLEEE